MHGQGMAQASRPSASFLTISAALVWPLRITTVGVDQEVGVHRDDPPWPSYTSSAMRSHPPSRTSGRIPLPPTLASLRVKERLGGWPLRTARRPSSITARRVMPRALAWRLAASRMASESSTVVFIWAPILLKPYAHIKVGQTENLHKTAVGRGAPGGSLEDRGGPMVEWAGAGQRSRTSLKPVSTWAIKRREIFPARSVR